MSLIQVATILVTCLVSTSDTNQCLQQQIISPEHGQIAGAKEKTNIPTKTGNSIDVIISAKSALVWDKETGAILYEKNAYEKRPVASLSKILSALIVRQNTNLTSMVEIPPEVKIAQRKGADIELPVGDKASVYDLLSAGLIASANDAMVTLAVHISGNEETFSETANKFAAKNGVYSTNISNATGLDGGKQYSTAYDVKKLFSLAYRDQVLRNILVSEKGDLTTANGIKRKYTSTNRLLGTYLPVLAAKTGYTVEAGENLVIMTHGDKGQEIGAIVLGSEARFQDMKVLVEWIWRNYTWP